LGPGGRPPKKLAAEADEGREAGAPPSRISAAKKEDGENVDQIADSGSGGDCSSVGADSSAVDNVTATHKSVPGILTNQNSNDSAQSKLWRREDGPVKATVFEESGPREVVVRPKKLPENFDQSKISPVFLTNQKSRRGRPRNPDMPPVPGQYYYWKKDGNGLSLSYEPPIKNAKGKRVGQGYEYQGFLLPTDWEHLKGNFDEQTILSKIRAILKIKRFRTAKRRANRGAVAAKRGESLRSVEAG
jgi:hypothetical protein